MKGRNANSARGRVCARREWISVWRIEIAEFVGGFAGRGGSSHLFRFHSSGRGVFDRCDKGFRGHGGRHACCEAYDLSGSEGPAAPGIGEGLEEDFPMFGRALVLWSVVAIAVAGHGTLAGPVLDIDPSLVGIPRGGIVVDRQPFNTGGPAADTDLITYFGNESWQQVADEFVLTASTFIRHVTWWGFYGDDFESPAQQPPTTQTMRLRFYDSRPQNGLPGVAIYEDYFVEPSYRWTGRQVLIGAVPREYKFDVNLTTPVLLAASTVYWLEIVQLGSRDSYYRWEISVATRDGYAFLNDATGDWVHTGSAAPATLAFQLSSIPEPSTAALMLLLCCCFCCRGGRISPC